MTTRAVRIVAASLFGLAAGTSLAFAQAKRPWVDPPADLSAAAPVEKPRVEEPAKPAPVAAKPTPEAEVARAKPEPKPEAAKVEAEAQKPEREVAGNDDVEAPKATPSKPRVKAAAKPAAKPRIAHRRNAPGARPDGLVEMRMQTLQFPDGRTVTVLTPPDEAVAPILRREVWR